MSWVTLLKFMLDRFLASNRKVLFLSTKLNFDGACCIIIDFFRYKIKAYLSVKSKFIRRTCHKTVQCGNYYEN